MLIVIGVVSFEGAWLDLQHTVEMSVVHLYDKNANFMHWRWVCAARMLDEERMTFIMHFPDDGYFYFYSS